MNLMKQTITVCSPERVNLMMIHALPLQHVIRFSVRCRGWGPDRKYIITGWYREGYDFDMNKIIESLDKEKGERSMECPWCHSQMAVPP